MTACRSSVLAEAGGQGQRQREADQAEGGHPWREVGRGRPPAAYADHGADGDEDDGRHGQPGLPGVGDAQTVPDAAESEEGERGVPAGIGARGEHRDAGGVGRARTPADQRGHDPRQLEEGDGEHRQPGPQAPGRTTGDDRRHREEPARRGQRTQGRPEDDGCERPARAGPPERGGGHQHPRQDGVPEHECPLTQAHPLDHERVPDREAGGGQPRRRAESGRQPERAPPRDQQGEDEEETSDHATVHDGGHDGDDGVQGHGAGRRATQADRGVGQRLVRHEDQVARQQVAGVAQRCEQHQRQRDRPQDEQHHPRAGHPSSDRPYPGRRSA